MPDDAVEILPGRTVPALEAAAWWGGEPLNRFSPAAEGLPSDHGATLELFRASRERAAVNETLVRTQIGGLRDYPDPALVPALRERLAGIVRRIKELGGVIRDG